MTGRGAEHDVDAAHVGQQRLERVVDDELHAHRGGEVQDVVGVAHELVHDELVAGRALDERDAAVGAQVLDVDQAPGAEIVQHGHLVAKRGQRVAQVRADEARAAGDEVPHAGTSIGSSSNAATVRRRPSRRLIRGS